MYLETWMIVTLVIAFGACAFWSRGNGYYAGAARVLEILEEQRLIKIDDDGQIKRWTPYAELPAKKTRKKKVDI